MPGGGSGDLRQIYTDEELVDTVVVKHVKQSTKRKQVVAELILLDPPATINNRSLVEAFRADHRPDIKGEFTAAMIASEQTHRYL